MRIITETRNEIKIFIGSREGYRGRVFSLQELKSEIAQLQDSQKITSVVRITKCEYLFKDYNESGFEISMINYPRFPKSKSDLMKDAMCLASHLMTVFKQNRVSLMDGQSIHMLEADNPEDSHKELDS